MSILSGSCDAPQALMSSIGWLGLSVTIVSDFSWLWDRTFMMTRSAARSLTATRRLCILIYSKR